jgi:hypothetical protein
MPAEKGPAVQGDVEETGRETEGDEGEGDAKGAQEVRNWYDRTASKARIVLSPLGEK